MTYDEFELICEKIIQDLSMGIRNVQYDFDDGNVIFLTEIGGYAKGSLEEEAEPYKINDDKIPENTFIDMLLENEFEDITYLKYKEICELCETSTFSLTGWYGNSIDFHKEIYNLRDIWEIIIARHVNVIDTT